MCSYAMNRKFILLFIFLLSLIILLVPKENEYFSRVSNDFGEIHAGQVFDPELLRKIGDYEFHNRIIFSQFDYQFGTISVSYYGFLSFIVFERSEYKDIPQPNITV